MRLRSLLPLVFFILILASCSRENKFTVIGTFTNMPVQKVRLQELGIDDKMIVLDSTRTDADGKFELAGEASQPGLYQVIFEHGQYIILTIDKGNVKLNGDFRAIDQYEVQGSASSSSIKNFLHVINDHIRDIQTLDAVIKQLRQKGRDSSAKSAEQDLANVTTGLTNFVEKYADTTSYLQNALFAVRILDPVREQPYMQAFLQGLPRRFNNAPLAKDFTDRYNKMITQRSGQQQGQAFTGGPVMGAVAPGISLPTPDGNLVSLASLKGKYVLLDFWASWCGPCRAENPNVVAAFNKYKDKNFTVFSVSLDDNKDHWLKAIKDDGLTWTHVSDLKKWESIAARDYGVEAIPTNFLLDKEGKIIARDLRGDALDAKLAEVLK